MLSRRQFPWSCRSETLSSSMRALSRANSVCVFARLMLVSWLNRTIRSLWLESSLLIGRESAALA